MCAYCARAHESMHYQTKSIVSKYDKDAEAYCVPLMLGLSAWRRSAMTRRDAQRSPWEEAAISLMRPIAALRQPVDEKS